MLNVLWAAPLVVAAVWLYVWTARRAWEWCRDQAAPTGFTVVVVAGAFVAAPYVAAWWGIRRLLRR